jgi:hypothetical protein
MSALLRGNFILSRAQTQANFFQTEMPTPSIEYLGKRLGLKID